MVDGDCLDLYRSNKILVAETRSHLPLAHKGASPQNISQSVQTGPRGVFCWPAGQRGYHYRTTINTKIYKIVRLLPCFQDGRPRVYRYINQVCGDGCFLTLGTRNALMVILTVTDKHVANVLQPTVIA